MTEKEMLENVPFKIFDSKLVARNTVYYKDNIGNEYIRLYKTDIVIRYKMKDVIRLSSGGYKSKTTKDRINTWIDKFLGNTGYKIIPRNGIWYIADDKRSVVFTDGMMLYKENGEFFIVDQSNHKTEEDLIKLNKKIHEYCKEFIEKFMNDEIPAPSNTDCWFCAIFPNTSAEHIYSHLDEKYYVPSMLYNSIFNNKESSISQVTLSYTKSKWNISRKYRSQNYPIAIEDLIKDQLTKNLKKYIKLQLGLPR